MVRIILISLVALSLCLALNGAPKKNIKERDFIQKSIIKTSKQQRAFKRAAPKQEVANPEKKERKWDPRDSLGVDMIMPKTRSVGIKDLEYQKWPNGVVPYIYLDNFSSSERQKIQDAMNLINTKTGGCISFVPRTNQNDYISFIKDSGCYSYVGRVNGRQPVSLGNGCVYLGTITHELMHALGFHHEQNRADRDQFITIDFNNVQSGLENQFTKISTSESSYHGTSYDYQSIMQYSEYAFSKNGQKTIVPPAGIDLIPSYDKTYAQVMTNSDISAVQKLYGCSATVSTSGPSVTEATAPPPSTASPITGTYGYTLRNNLYYTVYVYYRSTTERGYGNFYQSISSNQQSTFQIEISDHFEYWIYANGWIKLGEIEIADAQNDNYMTAYELYQYFHSNN